MKAFTEARLLQTARVVVVGGLSLVGFMLPLELGAPLMLLGGAGGSVFGWALSRTVAQRWWARLVWRAQTRLAEAEADPSLMRRLFDDLAEAYRLTNRAPDWSLRMLSGLVLTAEERWSEARAALQDLAPASDRSLADTLIFENTVAWVLAHAGSTAEGVDKAEHTLARAAGHPLELEPELLGYLHGTLGAALFLDERPAAAIPSLRWAIATGGNDLAQATRYYYLGMARSALAEHDDARQALTRAHTLAPATRWARLADEQLSRAELAPYR